MPPEPDTGPVVVGVNARQDAVVPREAAALAQRMRTTLVCVWIDTTRLPHEGDGTDAATVPIDPDVPDTDGSAEAAVRQRLREAIGDVDVAWSLVRASGEVVNALRAVAETYDAALLVVGTRRPGVAGWVDEAIGGSVAGHLAHSQRRPVVVVPQGRPS